jgi:uroporphyrinogen decarboxylase
MKIKRPFKEGADFEHLRKVLMRETREGPVPIIELGADNEVMAAVTGIELPKDLSLDAVSSFVKFSELAYVVDSKIGGAASPDVNVPMDMSEDEILKELEHGMTLMNLSLEYSKAVGYDYVTVYPVIPIPRTRGLTTANPQQQGRVRTWQDEHRGLITNRQEFERFPWPSPDKIQLMAIDYLAGQMPEGMKVMVFYFGVFEDLKLLMGLETMAIKSIEEPDLLDDILEQLTILAETTIDRAAAHPATGALFYGEDMGFNAGLMLSPTFMREHVIPRHTRIAKACHKHNKPFLFHSCGRIDALMDDLIHRVGIDARHSFQDNIIPIEEAYKQYGDRISLLGGIDVDLLARATPEKVRVRTRQILDTCAPGGGLCIGSGNSVTNFCKIENYYAMIDETRKWNEERGYL